DLSEDQGLSKDEDLSEDEDLSKDEILSKHLSTQLHEYLSQLPKHTSYQPQFLSKNRAGKPQNLSEDSNSLKLFQLFFTVKEMKNIVKQTNQQTAYTSFDTSWMPLTVIKAYHYLECLVYMRIQSL